MATRRVKVSEAALDRLIAEAKVDPQTAAALRAANTRSPTAPGGGPQVSRDEQISSEF